MQDVRKVLDRERKEQVVPGWQGHDRRIHRVALYSTGRERRPAHSPTELFGRGFDGPMLGHGPGMPIHYDLHAWIAEANPSGVFAQWNPAIRCP